MKSEKGITLTSLVVYIIVATLVISAIATLSSFFLLNASSIQNQEDYAPQFTKFNMFFVQDVKNNRIANVDGTQITFEDGTVYTYNEVENAIYRNETKITELIQNVSYTSTELRLENTSTTKQIITVKMTIGNEANRFPKDIEVEYVLKYW